MTGFSDPVSGGGILVQPEIRSPDFVPGVSGWIIRADGTAEFHGLTVTGGTLVISGAGQGIFLYSGAPAPGNLIASVTSAPGTDPQGNAYVGGIAVYDSGSGNVVEMDVGKIFLFNSAALFFEASPEGIFVYQSPGGAGNLIASIAPASGTDSFGNSFVRGVGVYDPVSGNTGQLDAGLLGVTSSSAGGLGRMLWTAASLSGVGGAARNIAEVTAVDTSTLQTIVDVIAPTGAKRGAVAVFGWQPTGAVALPVSLVLVPAGSGLSIAEGASARMGTGTLAGGTATIANTSVTANTRCFITMRTHGPNSGFVSVAVNAGVGFTVSSSNASDGNSFNWLLIEAA